MQVWPDDEHMSSKHVDAWNKLIVKQTFCASSWLITEIYWDARSAKRQNNYLFITVTTTQLDNNFKALCEV